MIDAATSVRIERAVGAKPVASRALGGGCVGDVCKLSLADGRVIVAKRGDADAGLDIEGMMLDYLATHSELPVPGVLLADDDLLLMEFIEAGGSLDADAEAHAARLIAALHEQTADRFGFHAGTLIGGLPQPNPWSERWVDFFRDHRLLYMAGEARDAGRLPGALHVRIERFAGHLGRWLSEPARPALLHGDLWSGNVLTAAGRITGFVDPAIYYGDPEIELAFATLFNSFTAPFFERYAQRRPITPGFFEERRDLYNLYPLLVHVRLFGGSYVASVEHTLRRFGF